MLGAIGQYIIPQHIQNFSNNEDHYFCEGALISRIPSNNEEVEPTASATYISDKHLSLEECFLSGSNKNSRNVLNICQMFIVEQQGDRRLTDKESTL